MSASRNKVLEAARNGKRKPTRKSPRKPRTLVGGRRRERPDPSVPLPEPTATFTL